MFQVAVKREKKDSVLNKHKKWLSDIQKTRERLEKEYQEEVEKKEEVHKKFQEQTKRDRLATLGLTSDGKDSNDDAKPETNHDSPAEAKSSLEEVSRKEVKSSRPAWALTQQAAVVAEEKKEVDDADSLLEFAQSLDFNKYMDDLEMKVMMEQMKRRIAELEKDVGDEDKRAESDARELGHKRDQLALMGSTMGVLAAEEGKRVEDRDLAAIAAAKLVLDRESSLLNIHSTKSVAAIVKSTQASLESQPKVLDEPRVVVHDPRPLGELNVSNLPYLHRNPAV